MSSQMDEMSRTLKAEAANHRSERRHRGAGAKPEDDFRLEGTIGGSESNAASSTCSRETQFRPRERRGPDGQFSPRERRERTSDSECEERTTRLTNFRRKSGVRGGDGNDVSNGRGTFGNSESNNSDIDALRTEQERDKSEAGKKFSLDGTQPVAVSSLVQKSQSMNSRPSSGKARLSPTTNDLFKKPLLPETHYQSSESDEETRRREEEYKEAKDYEEILKRSLEDDKEGEEESAPNALKERLGILKGTFHAEIQATKPVLNTDFSKKIMLIR